VTQKVEADRFRQRPCPWELCDDGVVSSQVDSVAVVGGGRVGTALVAALGLEQPFGRGFDGDDYDVVILAVPDAQIEPAAACIRPGPVVGHCSGLTGLDVLRPHEAFGLHPLTTLTHTRATFRGAWAAVEGSTRRAQTIARELADRLGMTPFDIRSDDRAAYHAAAAIASNYLVTLEDAAETLLATTGNQREILLPLVRAALDHWVALGGRAALTGPIARGDEATVARQRDAVETRCPELLPLFDALAERTRALAQQSTDS
jgi:predicted short-subunit dehydrogenase-like oxidoreductase (DUF2520 family)